MSQDHYARIADLYDQFVRTDYDTAFFINETRKAEGPVLELMAGTGRLTLPLLEAGVQVVAVDFSEEMLAVLRAKLAQKGLSADVRRMDVRELNLGTQFSRIILPFQAFPEITDAEDQKRALRAIYRHLKPGGEFICTLHNPAVRLRYVDSQLRLATRQELEHGGQLLVWLLQQHDPHTNLVEVQEFFEEYDGAGLMTSRRYSRLQFHLLEYDRFVEMLRAVGFEVAQVYGDYACAPFVEDSSPFMIWVLRRGT